MTDPLDRRSEDHNPLIDLLHTMHSDVKALNKTLSDHIENEARERAVAIKVAMAEAFPDGDPKGHREAHEAQMQAIRDRAAFWKTMRFEVTKYGLFGVLGWLCFIVWAAFVKGPK